MWFQSTTMIFNAGSRKTTNLETNKCRPYVLNQICEMRTSDYGQGDTHEAQYNAIGRNIGFNDGLFCDSTSQIVYVLGTQPPAPNTHSLHIKREHSPLTAENWSHEQDYGGDIPFIILHL